MGAAAEHGGGTGSLFRQHARPAQARPAHPAGRRLRLRLGRARRKRHRPAISRQVCRHDADGGDRGGDPAGRRDNDAGRRGGPGQGRLPGRSAAGRRRSAGEPGDPARSQQAAGHHEGRHVPQGTRAAFEPHALELAGRMNISGRFWTWFWLAVIGLPLVVFVVWANLTNPRQVVSTLLKGGTPAGPYFLVASGFTLVFGLMRNVNLAHGSLFLLGAYIGWVVGDATDNWFLAIAAGFASAAPGGVVLPGSVFRFLEGPER